MRRRDLITTVAASVLIFPAARAQGWQTRPIRVSVGSAARSPVNAPTRALTHRLSARYGQQFIIENRAGASGVIAVEVVTKAALGGHTLLSSGPGEIIKNCYIWKNSVLAYIKVHPARVTIGVTQMGTTTDLASAFLTPEVELKLTIVRYFNSVDVHPDPREVRLGRFLPTKGFVRTLR
jgi:tripartite-type tricarboxylate transporter receptor subunit TctC